MAFNDICEIVTILRPETRRNLTVFNLFGNVMNQLPAIDYDELPHEIYGDRIDPLERFRDQNSEFILSGKIN